MKNLFDKFIHKWFPKLLKTQQIPLDNIYVLMLELYTIFHKILNKLLRL